MERFEITPVGPFDAIAAFGFFARCRDEAVERVEGATLRRALLLRDVPVTVAVTSVGSVDAPRLTVEVRGGEGVPALVEHVGATVRRMLNTDADPRAFLELCRVHPLLATVIEARRGIRPVGTPSVFEAVVWAITGQHVSLHVACLLKGRLVRLLGHEYEGLRLFPTPAAVASADPDQLGQLGFTRAKHGAIIGLAAAVAAGDFEPESLAGETRVRARERLTSFRGVGPWTAEYVLARGLGAPDGFPSGDAGLRHAIARLTSRDEVTQREIEAFGEPFAGYRSWLTFLLWSLL